MQRSRSLAVLALVGAAIAGGAAGFGLGRYTASGPQPCFERGGRVCWDRVVQEWGLTQAQRTTVDSLLDEQRRTISSLYAPLRPQLDSLGVRSRLASDQTQARIREVLTPEQRVQFDAMRAEELRRREELREQQARDDSLTRRP